jgi:hypothetical protein
MATIMLLELEDFASNQAFALAHRASVGSPEAS